ncbi:hypothetical protein PUNSTDRAFT_42438 [Punctularia strigosozonata HHB-11173 SS5]|uniref:uncharacterized protein n=1 Tax=Punctularia strigosozonata (strain HHB-11173) TaxID=741275 RepID=UPI0004417D83|nr:uncharacterized protein PUNSTDRAFT_42438 [Punctularia strigosozonata HHB-11173 SS5]EIN13014.1 hypothetical protein PUNSTDRAFT_42438 [Punctularia strigosozonata HHB-11173 SS5]
MANILEIPFEAGACLRADRTSDRLPIELYPQAIAALEDARTKLDSNDQRQLDSIGLSEKTIPSAAERERLRLQNLDALSPRSFGCARRRISCPRLCYRVHWKITQFKKYSKPSRIGECVTNCEFVVNYMRDHGERGSRDMIPQYTLAVALARAAMKASGGEGKLTPEEYGQNSALWARAEWTRFLRRTGDIKVAEKVEEDLRNWYATHPYGIPPSVFKGLMLDEGEETNVIMEGIPNFGAGVIEFGGLDGPFNHMMMRSETA